ncbi:ATP-binding protein [Gemmatimonas groenlandica]|uniref:histidine kinase n=1 Tax=Gemmatimonas groenlandica TaxID=2732249 RepID=A0A6M4IT38_9BACT|nr:ATP-binding protein [Gemmatimonas groenlandica]QJR37893.1 response regulator [Gemmatimonas groenlandica]
MLGTLACYRREVHVPTSAEKNAMALLVNTAALILDYRREIHARQATQEALLRNEQRFRSFVTATSQITWTTDAQGNVIEDSPSWRAFTGQTYKEWIQTGWLQALHPDDRQATFATWQASVATRSGFEAEYRVLHADGDYRWTAVRGVPVLAQDGSVREWVGTNTDITERKRAEGDLRRLAARLSEEDHRKTEFLATLAHELRNPLAPIQNGLELLRLAGNNPEIATKVRDMMQRQLSHLVHLVDDLLDVARINSGKVELRKEQVELRTIVTNAVESTLAVMEAAHHELDLSMADESLVVDADPVRLVQVLGNLLTNAAKYTPEHGRIKLSVDREGQHAVIAVRDNGIGIPPQALPSVFDMFTQVAAGAGRAQGGLGIGLSLVRRLVEMHGGTVTAASPGEGEGSTFTVRLPVVQQQQVDAPLSQDQVAPIGKTGSVLKVLVADDNVDAAESLATLLELGGHKTTVAHDGHDALRLVLQRQPDVAFLDIGMPELNGYEVARMVRQTSGTNQTVLVALTGWGAHHDQDQAREAGFDYHLTKPAGIEAIHALLEAVHSARAATS